MTLTQLSADLVDGEGNLINFDCAYSCRTGILKVIDSIRSIHGENVRIVPISGASGGGGIFQRANPDPADTTDIKRKTKLSAVLAFLDLNISMVMVRKRLALSTVQWAASYKSIMVRPIPGAAGTFSSSLSEISFT